MVEGDQYCIDILTQISAVQAGLRKVAVELLEDHIRHCLTDSLARGEDPEEKVREATAAVDRLLKS
jgi:DNA-binding FrmR family transcriptional regulator